jgi:anti-anti-sigma factor
MVVSSRTPEGQPHHCPICGSDLRIEPSDPAGDAPCPQCGHLLWFVSEHVGNVQVIKPDTGELQPELLDRLADAITTRPGTRLVFDFGDIHHVSSAFLGSLIQLKRQLPIATGRIALRHVHPDLLEVFRITRLDQVFDLEKP